ncbi:alpha-amylase family protein [Cronobacter dublinensis]
MSRLWHQNAVIYQIDPTRFFDSNADGWGDLRGIVEKLDYVESLGATAIWLTPFYLSPRRDNGYDVENHTEPDPRIGSLEDVEWLIAEAGKRDIRVIIELVAQHTSDTHNWFLEARKGRDNPFHDFYLWRDAPGPDEPAPMFPTVEPHIWRFDEQAQRYYRHLFYHHEPDLNLRHPDVIQAIDRVLRFWAEKGVAGFRVDAASHMVEQASLPGDRESGYRLFNHFYDLLTEDHPDMILLGEVDVNVSEFKDFFGGGKRLTTLLNFWINKNTLLALAREEAAPLVKALNELPMPPANGGYCFWLRNHDELDLEDLAPEDYDFVMEKYAPDPDMRIYGRGIRRRLAPMLNGDERQQAMAHALLFSLPGTPVVRYGAEIGMGDLLSQPEREAVRTPMQWHAGPGAGFSACDPARFVEPLITDGPFRYETINVEEQEAREGSLLHRIRAIIAVWRTLPEICYQHFHPFTVREKGVFAVRYQNNNVATLMLTNLSREPVTVDLGELDLTDAREILADDDYPPVACELRINGYGYRWLRVR